MSETELNPEALRDLYEALNALLAAVAANPSMRGREYIDLGIQVNAALRKATSASSTVRE